MTFPMKTASVVAAVVLLVVAGLTYVFWHEKSTRTASQEDLSAATELASTFVSVMNAADDVITAVEHKPLRSLDSNTLPRHVDLDAALSGKLTDDEQKILGSSVSRAALNDVAQYEWRIQSPPREAPDHEITHVDSRLNRVGVRRAGQGHLDVVFTVVTERSYGGEPDGLPWSEETYFVGAIQPERDEFDALDRLSESETRERWTELESTLEGAGSSQTQP